MVDGNNATFSQFVNGVFRECCFGVAPLFDFPKLFPFGKEKDIEAKALHGLADVVLELCHLGFGLCLKLFELGFGGPVKVGHALPGGEPDTNGSGCGEGRDDEVELSVFDFLKKHDGR